MKIQTKYGYNLEIPDTAEQYKKDYESYKTDLVICNLKLGEIFLDLGAGIGYYTILASRIVGNNGKVYAFEPTPAQFHFLEQNVKENNCQNVEYFQKAVGNYAGRTKLVYYSDFGGNNRIQDLENFAQGSNKIDIDIVKLDDLIKEKIDFVKMDIEGSEFLALDGMREIIEKSPKMKMIIEFPDFKAEEMGKLLEEMKFKCYEIAENVEQKILINNMGDFLEKKGTKHLYCKRCHTK